MNFHQTRDLISPQESNVNFLAIRPNEKCFDFYNLIHDSYIEMNFISIFNHFEIDLTKILSNKDNFP